MSGVPRTPSTPGRDSAVASRSSSAGRLAIAMRVGAGRRARRGRGGRPRRAAAARRRRAGGAGRGRSSLGDPLRARRARISVSSTHVVTASSQRCGRPGPLRSRPRRHGGRSTRAVRRRARRPRWRTRGSGAAPSRRAVRAQRPAEGVAGAEAVDHVDRDGRTSTRSSRSRASTPSGPCLTTASSSPRSSRASAARFGSRLADRDLALLAVADGDGRRARGPCRPRRWPRRGRPRTSAGSRGRGSCAGAAPAPARRRRGPSGRAPGTAR